MLNNRVWYKLFVVFGVRVSSSLGLNYLTPITTSKASFALRILSGQQKGSRPTPLRLQDAAGWKLWLFSPRVWLKGRPNTECEACFAVGRDQRGHKITFLGRPTNQLTNQLPYKNL